MNKTFVYLNGQIIEEEKACLHISDLSIQRGYGVFDFCKTINYTPLFIDDHINRFFHSAEIMRLPMNESKISLRSVINDLIKKNQIAYSGVRMILTGGYSTDGFEISTPNLIIQQKVLSPRSEDLFAKGIKLITHEYAREFAEAKTINYSMGIWLQQKIRHHHAQDVLYQKNGEVSELPRANFFIVTRNDVVVTSADNVLKGVVRMKTIGLAKKHFKVEERNITMQDILQAKEAFISSTTKRILPVIQIDEHPIANGKPGKISYVLDAELERLELAYL